MMKFFTQLFLTILIYSTAHTGFLTAAGVPRGFELSKGAGSMPLEYFATAQPAEDENDAPAAFSNDDFILSTRDYLTLGDYTPEDMLTNSLSSAAGPLNFSGDDLVADIDLESHYVLPPKKTPPTAANAQVSAEESTLDREPEAASTRSAPRLRTRASAAVAAASSDDSDEEGGARKRKQIYECIICHDTFESLAKRDRHEANARESCFKIREKYINISKNECLVCKKEFKRALYLRQHCKAQQHKSNLEEAIKSAKAGDARTISAKRVALASATANSVDNSDSDCVEEETSAAAAQQVKRRYRCINPLCSHTSHSALLLSQHEQTDPICGRVIKTKYFDYTLLSCRLCGAKYTRLDNLKKHFSQKHDIELRRIAGLKKLRIEKRPPLEDTETISCLNPNCGETFDNYEKRRRHMKRDKDCSNVLKNVIKPHLDEASSECRLCHQPIQRILVHFQKYHSDILELNVRTTSAAQSQSLKHAERIEKAIADAQTIIGMLIKQQAQSSAAAATHNQEVMPESLAAASHRMPASTTKKRRSKDTENAAAPDPKRTRMVPDDQSPTETPAHQEHALYEVE